MATPKQMAAEVGLFSGMASIAPNMKNIVDQMLNRGAKYSEIAAKTGNPIAVVRNYTDATRPGYGVTPQVNGMSVNLAPGTEGGTLGSSAEAAEEAARAGRLIALRDEIKGKRGAVLQAYDLLFGDVDNLAKTRAGEVEAKAGKNVAELTENYTASIPKIQSSYAALGAGDSTDTRDARITADTGYKKGVDEVGENKKADLSKIGSYVNESKGKWSADKDSILRLIDRADQSEDEGDLRQARNDIENKVGTLGADRATLSTDAGARGELSKITSDAGRFDAIKASLDNIMASSLAGGVKQAAVQAVAQSADLTDEEKEKVKVQYGNVYDTPAVA